MSVVILMEVLVFAVQFMMYAGDGFLFDVGFGMLPMYRILLKIWHSRC